MVEPFANIFSVAANGGDVYVATTEFISAIHQHEKALGPAEARRELELVAYALEKQNLCGDCVTRLRDEETKISG